MKTDLNLNTTKSSIPRLAGGTSKLAQSKSEPKTPSSSPDYKVDLSAASKIPTPPLPTGLATMPSPSAPMPEVAKPEAPVEKEIPKEVKNLKEIDKLKEINKDKKVPSEKRPLVVFIKGLGLMSSPSQSEGSYAGVGRMAESIEGSRIYGWDQHDEIIKEVSKIHRDYPVVLVGHSLGGDTAMEVAEELDSLEHGFRKVDLLVTLDSVGFDNDIVPQNVKNHLNIFGEDNFILNDGPHVARKHDRTEIKNILSTVDHTEMDDHKEIQFEIISKIQETISRKV